MRTEPVRDDKGEVVGVKMECTGCHAMVQLVREPFTHFPKHEHLLHKGVHCDKGVVPSDLVCDICGVSPYAPGGIGSIIWGEQALLCTHCVLLNAMALGYMTIPAYNEEVAKMRKTPGPPIVVKTETIDPGCRVEETSSRMCERDTKGCIIHHS